MIFTRWFQWYPFTFVMAIVWLCFLTYLMVWMVTIIGFTFGIPDSVMGITFLAAGSSVPDAMSSVLVVRQGRKSDSVFVSSDRKQFACRLGLVDMGVSNTFGSNVFDLLVGLALPWFVKTLLSGEAVHINSNGLMYDSVLLLGIVAITVRLRLTVICIESSHSLSLCIRSLVSIGENGTSMRNWVVFFLLSMESSWLSPY